jgi:hypothetical protein
MKLLKNFIKFIVYSAIVGNVAGCIIFSTSFIEAYYAGYPVAHSINNIHEGFFELLLISYFLACTFTTMVFFMSDSVEIKIK